MNLYRSALLCLFFGLQGVPAMADAKHDLAEPVWVDGEKVTAYVILPGAGDSDARTEPSDEFPDVKVYLVGPMDPESPFRPGMRFDRDPATGKPPLDSEGNELEFLVTPDHDDTFTRFVDEHAPADAFGYWIIAGPNATGDTVRTRPQPDQSIAAAPLAWAVKLDGEWRNLTAGETIERALRDGLLAEKFSNWGGVAWLRR